jgi:hypothetical protein
LNSANFAQRRLSGSNSAFSHIEFGKVSPGSRVVSIELNNRFKCFVRNLALLAFQRNQTH